MKPVADILKNKLYEALVKVFPLLEKVVKDSIDVIESSHEKFGHYQSNIALQLAKVIGLTPRVVAEKIVQNLDYIDNNILIIEKAEVAGAGFINITLNAQFLSTKIEKIVYDDHFCIDNPKKPKRIIIDFSSPNVAKEMHVGHLRSTIIGDCLARLFEFLGHDVVRLNHLGDWGTSFGMLIAYIKKYKPRLLFEKESISLQELVLWYKESKKFFDNDAEFKKSSQLEVVALQGGEPEAIAIWKLLCAISQKAYQEIYDLLDVKITDRGESFYNLMLSSVVKDFEQKGLVTISDGARCIFLEGFETREGTPLPLIIQKSDGGYNYDTTDLAAFKHRVEDEKADRIIYVTDAGQSLHFQMIFEAVKKAGYFDPAKIRVDHVPFGLVLGPDGKRFRTRSGDTERLIDLLYAAINKAKEILLEKMPDISDKERDAAATILGIGAVKYADLSSNRNSDYVFSYDRMLKFEGNTAAFLLYSYVRVEAIKRKVKISIQDLIDSKQYIILKEPSEIALGVHLLEFEHILAIVADKLLPHYLTDYLYVLAVKFNVFFRDCRVEGSLEQNSRLLLCELVGKTLKQGLQILGIKTVQRM